MNSIVVPNSSFQFTPDYSSYAEWKNWNASNFACYSPLEDAYFRKELQECGIKDPVGLNCVEIGFGNGHFAAWCTNQNINYSGLEIIEQLVSQGKALGFKVDMSADNLQLRSSSIDLVVAFDVFEHFTWNELKEQLDVIHRWLKPRGFLVFRVPSGDSPFSRALQHGDITHKIAIGSSIVKQLAVDHGFEACMVKPPALPFLCGNLQRTTRRIAVRIGQLLVTKLIQTLYHHGKNTVISTNMVVVMRKIGKVPCA